MASDAWAICKEARRRSGMSQRALAAGAGVTPATVARIEKGRMEPTLDLLRRIVRAAGLELRAEVAAADPDERKAKLQAKRLTPEQRLEQNDALSHFALEARGGVRRDA